MKKHFSVKIQFFPGDPSAIYIASSISTQSSSAHVKERDQEQLTRGGGSVSTGVEIDCELYHAFRA